MIVFLILFLLLTKPVMATDTSYDALWGGAPLWSNFPVVILIENANVGDSFYMKLYGGRNGNKVEMQTFYDNKNLSYADSWNLFPVAVVGVGGTVYAEINGIGVGETGNYEMQVEIVSKKNTGVGYTTPIEFMLMTEALATPTPTPTAAIPTNTPTPRISGVVATATLTPTPTSTTVTNSTPTPTLDPKRYDKKKAGVSEVDTIAELSGQTEPEVKLVSVGKNLEEVKSNKKLTTTKKKLWWRVLFLMGSGGLMIYAFRDKLKRKG